MDVTPLGVLAVKSLQTSTLTSGLNTDRSATTRGDLLCKSSDDAGANPLYAVLHASATSTSRTLTLSTDGTSSSGSYANATILGLRNPTDASGAATKAYVDQVAQGLSVKNSVAVASSVAWTVTANLGAGTLTVTATNADLTAFTGTTSITVSSLTINAVTEDPNASPSPDLTPANRILLMGQTDARQNGIYYVMSVDDAIPNCVLKRTTDARYSASRPGYSDMNVGNFCFAEKSTTGAAGAGYVLNSSNQTVPGAAINPSSDATHDTQVWAQFNAQTVITGGSGITNTANTLNLDLTSNGLLVFNDNGTNTVTGVSQTVQVSGATKYGLVLTSNGTATSTVPVYSSDIGDTLASNIDQIGTGLVTINEVASRTGTTEGGKEGGLVLNNTLGFGTTGTYSPAYYIGRPSVLGATRMVMISTATAAQPQFAIQQVTTAGSTNTAPVWTTLAYFTQ